MGECPQIILDLVERFERNREAYRNSGYKEAELRTEFLNPFFEALGWDLANKSGKSETFKDVIVEEAVKIGGSTKAPDYAFRVGGARMFFVEAKKPSHDLQANAEPAYQLRRYAWNAKLPLSILTDFEEFVVYDCRPRPAAKDKAATARILYLNYKDYAARWDEIAGLISKEAVERGSLERFKTSEKGKRGTSAVDDEFLEDIERWRGLLARTLALRNRRLSERDLNFAVQRTLDRIIFLRIGEDRGIEPFRQLQDLIAGKNIYGRLCGLFKRADERYNSGIFHFHAEKDRAESPDELTMGLKVDDAVLKEIIGHLYYPQSPYEFSVISSDILGSIYERFLGKVIRLTKGHHAVVEEKPEVKKAGGVYYTPTYIVDYIVKNTVGKLCEGKTPREISAIRILDPACGSGSFLIGAYAYLLHYHRDWYVKDGPEKHSKEISQGPGGAWLLTTQEKKRILRNNIYGVDIDRQAVEVTKLSLLLKVLEHENQETLRLFHERALPDLGKNIKCGNSLIGPDYYSERQKELFDTDEAQRVNAFDWGAEFPDVLGWRVPEPRRGFDAVIGNPPYVVYGKDLYPSLVTSYLSRYPVAQYKTDLFHLFIQHGIDLLRAGGRFGYIVPNPWLTLQYTDQLRRYVLQKTIVDEIVVFGYRVFLNADVYTMLLLLEKGATRKDHAVRVKRINNLTNVMALESAPISIISQKSWMETEECVIETRLSGALKDFVTKLGSKWPPLENVARASLGCQAYNSSKHTQKQIADRVFHSDHKAGPEYLPELAGNDVSRYIVDRKRGQWIKYGSWLHDYRTMDWLQGPRVLVREIPGHPPYSIQACYVEKTFCNYKTILNVNPQAPTAFSMKYLTGLLNSRLLSFIFPHVSSKMIAQSFPRLSVKDVKRLPIRPIDFSDPVDKARHDKMVSLVERMLDLYKQLAAAKTPDDKTQVQRQIDATDREIDRLVYDLYGLTPDEINIVEGGSVA